ncbi:MAG: 23S rRNA (uracil(1939)-C(5))-methyltransferase RlmD [Muribaculaceae bacterium]|nr:23S rRNA (uracil(1939)-C(5))-methyltransferase RlmD [Muribaculaceae bacterium]
MGRKNKVLPVLEGVKITGMAAEGKALARTLVRPEDESPMVVFVPFAAPGDVVNIKLDKKKRSFAEGHIESIVSPSPDRITPLCPHFTVCGGCKWQHLPYAIQLKHKQTVVQDALERIGKITLPEINPILGSKKIWRYRNKMEYTFSDKRWRTWEEIRSGDSFNDTGHALGFHIPGAFDKVLHIKICELQSELGDEIRDFVFKYAESNNLTFYNLKENKGLLRTLMIRTSSTGEVMVCLVLGEEMNYAAKGLLESLKSQFPMLTSIVYVINKKLNDSISDQQIEVFSGNDYIEEEMEDLRFRVNAKSFYQTNSEQAYELYKVARKFAGLDKSVADKPLVYDLYTGTGTIANFVARNASKVIGIEYVPEAIEDAKLNSAVNNIDNTVFYAGDMKNILTDEFIVEHGQPDVIITDPPRAGMHEDVIEVILRSAPKVIVYVSCNPATQARDLALLDEAYEVTDVQPVDMFPHTHHVENVVRLQRRQMN